MESAIAKAGALIEAMEYIRAFRGRIVVVKLGGSVIDDESLRNEINNHLDSLPQDASGEDKANLLREVLSLDNQRLKRLVKRFELTEVVQLEQETAEVFSKQSQSV